MLGHEPLDEITAINESSQQQPSQKFGPTTITALNDLMASLTFLLPNLPITEKDLLFGKLIFPLRKMPSSFKRDSKPYLELEKNLARWLTLPQHKKKISKDKWHQVIDLPSMEAYGQVLLNMDITTDGGRKDEKEVCGEASRALADHLFIHLTKLEAAINTALSKKQQQQAELEELLKQLSLIRSSLCLTTESREKLKPLFAKLTPHLFRLKHLSPLLLEGAKLEEQESPFPEPYLYRCVRKLDALKSFPGLLKAFGLHSNDADWNNGWELMSVVILSFLFFSSLFFFAIYYLLFIYLRFQ